MKRRPNLFHNFTKVTIFEKSSFCRKFYFWDKWHCLVVWFYCLGVPLFFLIGQTKRSNKNFLWPLFVLLIILYWLLQQENSLVNQDKHKQICWMPKWFFICSSFAFFITAAIYHCIFEWCFWLEAFHGILGFHCIASWNNYCIAKNITALKISLWVPNKI